MKILRMCVAWGFALTAVAVLAACGSGSSSSGGGGGSSGGSSPITIGTSLSLSGDFAADGQAFERGYKLWADDMNAKGGLLGRQVKLQAVSALLTVPSSKIANRYGYAFVEGAGGGPAVFATGLKNVFDVSIPVKDNLI